MKRVKTTFPKRYITWSLRRGDHKRIIRKHMSLDAVNEIIDYINENDDFLTSRQLEKLEKTIKYRKVSPYYN